jgi:hypothetical protein
MTGRGDVMDAIGRPICGQPSYVGCAFTRVRLAEANGEWSRFHDRCSTIG